MGKNLSIVTISLLLLFTSTSARQVFDIKSYGGQPNVDITQLVVVNLTILTKAWKAACTIARSKVVISAGAYKLGVVTLLGPCKGAIEFNLQGTLQAPSNVASFNVFDGKGQMAWQKNNCAKKFDFVTNSIVRDIQSKDSKFFHINVIGCKNSQIQHVTIIAPGDSPNTDGIHIGRSSKITISNAKIGTGDDCISIGDGAQDVTTTQVTCGPGHGISVGSLGKYQNEQPVSGIRVIGDTLASPSKVKISNVSFKNVRGTSSTKEAVKLICSNSVPCQQVVVANIDLVYKGAEGFATSSCVNVKPTVSGKQNPLACTIKQ
ncbi:hypothetical protein ACJW30_03G149300 [Castanea mollissima]